MANRAQLFNTHDFSSGDQRRLNDRLLRAALPPQSEPPRFPPASISRFPFTFAGRSRSVAGCPTRADARGIAPSGGCSARDDLWRRDARRTACSCLLRLAPIPQRGILSPTTSDRRKEGCVPREIDRSKGAFVGGIDASRVSPRFASALSFPCTFAR